ncbi:MAG: heat-inducible transcriptional repressor HrcA [Pseudomonadota bacterium]
MSASDKNSVPTERAQLLLRTLIQRYIREGVPIGSRTLSRDSGLDLSPATIRNVLADLEDLGLVSAPHTSAGRVPTQRGYRMFVDTLIRYKTPKERDIKELQSELGGQSEDGGAIAHKVSDMLSRVTSLAGVVSVPKGSQAILRQIEFLPLSDSRVLAILVINDRDVQNRILHTAEPHTEDELTRAANYINENYAGVDLANVRERLLGDLERTRDSMNQAMLDIVSVAQSAMEGATADRAEFVLAGERNLMDFDELADIATLRRLFDAFSQRRVMLDLLDRSINASGVQIFIGQESGYQIFDDCSVITAPYRAEDNTIGVLGVIGPTRMAYDRVVPIVEVTARLLSTAIDSSES